MQGFFLFTTALTIGVKCEVFVHYIYHAGDEQCTMATDYDRKSMGSNPGVLTLLEETDVRGALFTGLIA